MPVWHFHCFAFAHPGIQGGVITAALCVQNVCSRLAMSQATWPWPSISIFPKLTASRLQRLARMTGCWEVENLTLPCLLFLMLTISYLELLKLSENCLFFWLSCQRTPTSFPITSQTDAWSYQGRDSEAPPKKMAAKTGLLPTKGL